jgi:hypothetical protein
MPAGAVHLLSRPRPGLLRRVLPADGRAGRRRRPWRPLRLPPCGVRAELSGLRLGKTRPFIAEKTPEEIERWNSEWLAHEPDNEPSRAAFVELRNAIAPDRTDVTTWADLLDLDEKRDVPRRRASTPA